MSSIFGAYAANLKVNKNEVAIKEDLNVFSFKSFFLFRPTSGCGLFFFLRDPFLLDHYEYGFLQRCKYMSPRKRKNVL